MLTVAKITQAAAAGYASYLDGRSQTAELGDYYLKDGQRVEAPGRWAAGADTLDINPEAPVTGEQLRTLMAVRRPDTGLALRAVGANATAVAAIDATFSAPKSVSAVWAVSPAPSRQAVERAHELAVDRALDHALTQVAMIRERIDANTIIHTKPAGLIATSWRHTTARAAHGQTPDPQLHSHVLCHGAVRRDGRVVAIDSRAWLQHARELGAAYRTELAAELITLGYEIRRGTGRAGRYFEIEGVPDPLLDAWSSRHRQVQAAIHARLAHHDARLAQRAAQGGEDGSKAAAERARLRRTGQLTPAEDRYLTIATRAGKDPRATHADLDHDWQTTAREHGLTPPALTRLQDQGRRLALSPVPDRELVDRLTEFEATFPGRGARAVALEVSAGSRIDDALGVLDQARASQEVLELNDGQSTTQAHRARERHTVALAADIAQRRPTAIDQRHVSIEASRLGQRLDMKGRSVTAEQRAAIELGCADRQLVVIEGHAGTGKSTVLTAVARAHEADGRHVVVTSTAALGAQRLAGDLADAGVTADAYSTVALHSAIKTGRVALGPEVTVIHDEAALASTREQHQLLTAVHASGARLIEVGDPHQSKAVGAGGLWTRLERAAHDQAAHVELTRNVRALDPADRRDQRRFRDGDIEQALAGYQARGGIITTPDLRHAEDHALENAHRDRESGHLTLVIAQTSNEHLDELNARAQAIRLQACGAGPSLAVAGRPYRLHVGDEVQVRRNLAHPQHGQLRNGTTGQVIAVDPDRDRLQLQLGPDRVALTGEQIAQADVRLAYVQHPMPAQGQTTDTAHLIVGEHTTREGSYVAITRARACTHIYAADPPPDPDTPTQPADRLTALAEQMSHSEPDAPSINTPLVYETAIDTAHNAERRPARAHTIDPETATPAPDAAIRTLGRAPEPDDPHRAAWQRAAGAIHDYRRHYQIDPDEPSPLGPQPPPGHFQQRHDHTQAAAQIRPALDPTAHTERDRPAQPAPTREPDLADTREASSGSEFEP